MPKNTNVRVIYVEDFLNPHLSHYSIQHLLISTIGTEHWADIHRIYPSDIKNEMGVHKRLAAEQEAIKLAKKVKEFGLTRTEVVYYEP